MKKKLFIIACVALLVLGGAFIVTRNTSSSATLKVTASFYPLAEFTKQIGGDKITVETLVGQGVEPHDYEPKPQQLARLYESKMLIYNGVGFEHWIDSLKGELASKHVQMVDTSRGITLLPALEEGESPDDPHIWLDPVRAQQQVRTIADALSEADPANADYYKAGSLTVIARLQELDRMYTSGLANCSSRTIVTSHLAFGYIANRYNLQLYSLSGLSPDEEPSPQKMAELTNVVKEQKVAYIFFETLASPKLADALAKEAGVKTVVFNPIEGVSDAEAREGKDYFSLQQGNLQNLRLALDCK